MSLMYPDPLLPSEIREEDKHDRITELRIRDAFDTKKHAHWAGIQSLEVSRDWRVFDLQTVLEGLGFSPLLNFQIEMVMNDISILFSRLDLRRPLDSDFRLPVIAPRNSGTTLHRDVPAVSITENPETDRLRLIFGKLYKVESGWRMTNREHIKNHGGIQPSLATYFKVE